MWKSKNLNFWLFQILGFLKNLKPKNLLLPALIIFSVHQCTFCSILLIRLYQNVKQCRKIFIVSAHFRSPCVFWTNTAANYCIGVSAYRPLSAFKTYEINDILGPVDYAPLWQLIRSLTLTVLTLSLFLTGIPKPYCSTNRAPFATEINRQRIAWHV